jgi:FSR family fosmidomycin resistance protein-like MFS transporter
VELSGVPGALLMGVYSDRLGRKRILSAAVVAAALLMLVFLRVNGWLQGLLLMALGFTVFATMPVIQAIVQEQFPNNRAVANGLFMMVTFVLRPLGTFLVGALGDWLGLPTAYLIAALVSLLILPAVWALPKT